MSPEGEAVLERDTLARMIAERVVEGVAVGEVLLGQYVSARDRVHAIRAERQSSVDPKSRESEGLA